MRCESGSESPMQRCQMAARDHQKIPQSNLKVNYQGHFLFWSKVCCLLKQVMNLHKSCYDYLAKITPLHEKKVISFSHLLVLCDILFYALCFPCGFHLAASTLCIFSNKDEGGEGRVFPGDMKRKESFMLASRLRVQPISTFRVCSIFEVLYMEKGSLGSHLYVSSYEKDQKRAIPSYLTSAIASAISQGGFPITERRDVSAEPH